ncbi:MAG: hypothetical protein HZB57_00435 [Gammaproteobacteria bacterium]|nr:hypothetical protein [Gammaproteobacteria bacterium]
MNTPPTGPTTGPMAPLLATTPVARSEPLATWRVGQILAATVTANPQPGVADLRIGSLLVKAQTGELSLSPGQNLRLEVASLKEMPVLKLLGLMQQNPVQQVLRDVLPRQQPLPLLFTALARLITPATPSPTPRSPSIAPEIVRLAQELLAKLPDTARASTADGLRQAIRDSGLFLESKLAQSAAQPQSPSAKPPWLTEWPAKRLTERRAECRRARNVRIAHAPTARGAGDRPGGGDNRHNRRTSARGGDDRPQRAAATRFAAVAAVASGTARQRSGTRLLAE